MSSAKAPTDGEWEDQKGWIRRLYIHQQCSVDKLLSQMSTRGFKVSRTLMEKKLKQWNLRRNINNDAWRSVDHAILKRKRQGKENIVTISGQLVKPEKVHRETLRNRSLPRLGKSVFARSPSPVLPENAPVVVCSPPPILLEFSWPQKLPWIQFENRYQDSFSSLFQCRFTQDVVLDQVVAQFAGLNLQKSNTPGAMQPSPQSLGQTAVSLATFLPGSNQEDSISRAEILLSGSMQERFMEIFKLFIIRVSNNLLGIPDHPLHHRVEAAWNLLQFLIQGSFVPWVSGASKSQDTTLLAFSDNLFITLLKYLCRYSFRRNNGEKVELLEVSYDMLHWLLRCGHNPHRPKMQLFNGRNYLPISPLQYAVVVGDTMQETVQLLLRHGADIHLHTAEFPYSALSIVLHDEIAFHVSPIGASRSSSRLACRKLVLDTALSCPGSRDGWDSILLFALKRGDQELLGRALSHEADMNCRQILPWGNFTSEITPSTCAAQCSSGTEWLTIALQMIPPHLVDPLSSYINPLISAASVGNDAAISSLFSLTGTVNVENGAGFTPLHAAAAMGHAQTCALLLSLGAKPDGALPGYILAIHLAAFSGQINVLRCLVEAGADINATFRLGTLLQQKPMQLHCIEMQFDVYPLYMGQLQESFTALEIIEWMMQGRLRSYSDPVDYSSWNLLHCFEYLVANGASISGSQISMAVAGNAISLVDFILTAGGDPHTIFSIRHVQRHVQYGSGIFIDFIDMCETMDGETVLQVALCFEHYEVAAALLDHGASPSGGAISLALRGGNLQICDRLCQMGAVIPDFSPFGGSFLEAAISSENLDAIHWALSVDPLYYDPGALCAAVQLAVDSGVDAYVQRLLQRRTNCPRPGDSILESTAVAIAADSNDINLLQTLLNILPTYNSCFVGLRNVWQWDQVLKVFWFPGRGTTPLYVMDGKRQFWREIHVCVGSPLTAAVKKNNSEILSTMLNAGYLPDQWVLCRALQVDNLELAGAILGNKLGPLPSVYWEQRMNGRQNTLSVTPLQMGVALNKIEVVELMLRYEQDPNDWFFILKHSRSPLQQAAASGNLEIVHILLAAGAEINDRPASFSGATALQFAAIGGHIGIAKMLLDHQEPADVNAHRASRSGRTALEGAAEHGRIDMVQLLLSSGVKTQGSGQRQYIRAIKFARQHNHRVVEDILRAHREWTEDDEIRLTNEDIDEEDTCSAESECSDDECYEHHGDEKSDSDYNSTTETECSDEEIDVLHLYTNIGQEND